MRGAGLGVSVAQLCRVQGVSRQAFYQWQRRQRRLADSEGMVLVLVRAHRREQPYLGTRKLHYLLRDDLERLGIKLGRDRLFALLARHGLLIRRKRRYARTTDAKHPFRCYDNLFKERKLNGPHQAWVADITYLRTAAGFRYLALLTDAYSRKIVGHDLSNSLSIEGSLRALNMAMEQLPHSQGVMHHSDRGVQYCSYAYTDRLKDNNMLISMAEAGNVYENAMAERVNGILKEEYGLNQTFASDAIARHAVQEAISLYNSKRPHLALDYLTPAQKHRQGLPLAA